jgi:hypothetical protein
MTHKQHLKKLERLIASNIQKVRWTLEDPSWKPSRDYLAKLLASYEAHTRKLLRAAR